MRATFQRLTRDRAASVQPQLLASVARARPCVEARRPRCSAHDREVHSAWTPSDAGQVVWENAPPSSTGTGPCDAGMRRHHRASNRQRQRRAAHSRVRYAPRMHAPAFAADSAVRRACHVCRCGGCGGCDAGMPSQGAGDGVGCGAALPEEQRPAAAAAGGHFRATRASRPPHLRAAPRVCVRLHPKCRQRRRRPRVRWAAAGRSFVLRSCGGSAPALESCA